MKRSALIFMQMMRRDFYGYAKKFPTLLTNFCIIYPALFAFSSGYLMPNVLFVNDAMIATILLAGQVVINIVAIAYSTNITLLFDLDGDRYIDYQITVLNARLVLLQRMLFAALFCALVTLPFFPIVKLFLGNNFVTTFTSWNSLICMIFFSAFAAAAYTIFLACYIDNPRQVVRFWLRVNFILVTLGGVFIPWHIMYQFSPILGYVVLCNPLLYITEGIRHALTQSTQFIPAPVCMVVLTLYSLLFMGAAWYYFKKRVDYV